MSVCSFLFISISKLGTCGSASRIWIIFFIDILKIYQYTFWAGKKVGEDKLYATLRVSVCVYVWLSHMLYCMNRSLYVDSWHIKKIAKKTSSKQNKQRHIWCICVLVCPIYCCGCCIHACDTLAFAFSLLHISVVCGDWLSLIRRECC